MGVKGLTFHTFQHLTPTATCSMLTWIFFSLFFLLVQCTLPDRKAAHSLPKDYAYSPHCSLYILDGTDKGNMHNDQQLHQLDIISYILMTLYCLVSSGFCWEKLDWYSQGLIFLVIMIYLPFIVFFKSSKQFFQALTLWKGKTKGH